MCHCIPEFILLKRAPSDRVNVKKLAFTDLCDPLKSNSLSAITSASAILQLRKDT